MRLMLNELMGVDEEGVYGAGGSSRGATILSLCKLQMSVCVSACVCELRC